MFYLRNDWNHTYDKNMKKICMYLKMTILKYVPAIPLIIADAFKWHRPCRTRPFTYVETWFKSNMEE